MNATFATDEDGEFGFLIGAPDATEGYARDLARTLSAEFDYDLRGEFPIRLRPYRQLHPGEDRYEDEGQMVPWSPPWVLWGYVWEIPELTMRDEMADA